MRSRAILVTAALAAAIPVAAACAAGGTAARERPTLTLASRNPVTVVGRNFVAHQHVKVTVIVVRTQIRRPIANAHGAFTARFTAVIDRCSGWIVTASQKGHAPAVIRGARPACPPA
jgi:hypothetical protein